MAENQFEARNVTRPETEQLVEHVLAAFANRKVPDRILDLGAGSGAIALALAQAFPAAAVTASDTSEDALALGRENASATALAGRVTFLASNWFSAIPAIRFDAIVSNPPYLSSEETAEAPPEVRGFEPAQALTSAAGGLADLSQIVAGAPQFLAEGGLLALETGIDQHERLLVLAREAGFSRSESKRDLAGRDRFVLAWL
jgi:release factor glutamine methyltransferase